MEQMKAWFTNLSKTGKVSVVSALAIGSLYVVGASSPPPASVIPISSDNTATQEVRTPVVTYDVQTETKPIPFQNIQREDSTIAKGTSYVVTAGVKGVETITHNITLTDGKETDRKSSSNITTAPIDQVTIVGTYVAPAVAPRSDCDPNYTPCVPNVAYDLDCADIGFSVRIIGSDPHGFDGRDNDGYGCESY